MVIVGLLFLHWAFQASISYLNLRYISSKDRRIEAARDLDLPVSDIEAAFPYSRDKQVFAIFESFMSTVFLAILIGFGGLAWLAQESLNFSYHPIMQGVFFFAALSFYFSVLSLPFELYSIFGIEEKYGFNRQTLKLFFVDKVKGSLLGAIVGGALLCFLLFFIVEFSEYWWVFAWVFIFGFSFVMAWAFPTLIAPLFNKFSPLPPGDLVEQIKDLAKKLDFNLTGLFTMNASLRSSHGNAYFTGFGRAKRIVLFDTLVNTMQTDEIVAVVGHELGHFKLKHITKRLLRSFFILGVLFFLSQKAANWPWIYEQFGLPYGASFATLLIVFVSIGVLSGIIQPLGNFRSRSDEFEADEFAARHAGGGDPLRRALLKLRENNRSLPLSHPLYSALHFSHPPLRERLAKLRTLS